MEPFYSHRGSNPSRVSLKNERGFTLVELLVVLAIIGSIMSVVLTNQSSFNKTFVLTNTTYDVALSLRNAQTYGLGSRAASGTANSGYGIHFQSATPNSFTLFADIYPSPNAANCHGLPPGGSGAPDAQSGNCIYEPASDQSINQYTLGNGITITSMCALISGSWGCASVSSLDIVFARPNPDPFIRANVSGITYAATAACLTLSSPQGAASRYLMVSSSGEIAANATSCP